jgi:probable O-glycosylation ligase (exosortase A-associated)
MFLQSKRRFILVPVMVLGLIVALFFTPDAWRARMDFSRPEMVDASAQSRLEAWAFARALAADYPITGGGFSTFTPELYSQYDSEVTEIGPHSVYFQVLAEHGYVGLTLYLLLVLSCLAKTRRLSKTARSHGDRIVDQYAHMIQFSLVGFLSSGIFLGRAYFDYFFTIVACLIILEREARERWAKPEPVPATVRPPFAASVPHLAAR